MHFLLLCFLLYPLCSLPPTQIPFSEIPMREYGGVGVGISTTLIPPMVPRRNGHKSVYSPPSPHSSIHSFFPQIYPHFSRNGTLTESPIMVSQTPYFSIFKILLASKSSVKVCLPNKLENSRIGQVVNLMAKRIM